MKAVVIFTITAALICSGCGLTAPDWKSIVRDGISAAAHYYEEEEHSKKAMRATITANRRWSIRPNRVRH